MILHKAIISIGSNLKDGETILRNTCDILSLWVRRYEGTRYLHNPAIGMGDDAPEFTNRLLVITTTLSVAELKNMLKHLEIIAGDTRAKRMHGIVTLDCDLDIYDGEVMKPRNVEREYFHILFAELGED